MANEIRTKLDAEASFTISLVSLATSVAGVGRGSTAVVNTNSRPAALIYLTLKSNSASAPILGAVGECYLLRDDDNASPYRTDGWTGVDAGLTISNAPMLGAIVFNSVATSTLWYGDFDTAPLGPLGSSWGIGVVNVSGQALFNVEADMLKRYVTYLPEIQ